MSHIIGLMSGTSLDGLDIVYCCFDKTNSKWTFKITVSETVSYPDEIKRLLIDSFYSPADIIAENDWLYGKYLGRQVNIFCDKWNIQPDYIASHGHTIFHRPDLSYTLQIGNGQAIADETGITVINDFRSQDINLGGQGAPLVPIGDELLFGQYDYCLNIGGFSNISFNKAGKRIAYDISPANMLINHLCNIINLDYDKDGKIAESNHVDSHLLHELNTLDYYNKPYPKSLGKEWFDSNIIPIIKKYQSVLTVEDLIATATEHVATQISNNITAHKTVLCTGGGAHNKHLINIIRILSDANIIIPDDMITDYKEALIFAFMAALRINNENNVFATSTGAKYDHCAGIITTPAN
ncbi:MAG: anhydro-N-acetylmuramic acid kinase [Bacteroidales bacterium]|jgi:anhydro-N-acetylmuramic acid kinase|nr:anhydro-N-acetylmuramic acid kinase [Bacteroidales bacterium]MDD3151740.1 anhydro-N-acetylmuramic acid kinase [Bacteroidales bacterium]MDD3913874.1 anhydro-N-acetylmuramic acid kinase [Bacteroidales bacterium]